MRLPISTRHRRRRRTTHLIELFRGRRGRYTITHEHNISGISSLQDKSRTKNALRMTKYPTPITIPHPTSPIQLSTIHTRTGSEAHKPRRQQNDRCVLPVVTSVIPNQGNLLPDMSVLFCFGSVPSCVDFGWMRRPGAIGGPRSKLKYVEVLATKDEERRKP